MAANKKDPAKTSSKGEKKFWYKIAYNDCGQTRMYLAATNCPCEELIEKLSHGDFFAVTDIFDCDDNNKFINWEWLDCFQQMIILNPQYIYSIIPYVEGDPRK